MNRKLTDKHFNNLPPILVHDLNSYYSCAELVVANKNKFFTEINLFDSWSTLFQECINAAYRLTKEFARYNKENKYVDEYNLWWEDVSTYQELTKDISNIIKDNNSTINQLLDNSALLKHKPLYNLIRLNKSN